jgi:DNA mismatch repair protein MutS
VAFESVLFMQGEEPAATGEPDYFGDLRLDQVVARIVAGRDEYRLEPFFRQLLTSVDAIAYRQEVFRDLDRPPLHEAVRTFAHGMRDVRQLLDRDARSHYRYEKARWFLDAADAYCSTVRQLAGDLEAAQPGSRALLGLSEFLAGYVSDADFSVLEADAARVRTGLGTVRYRLRISGPRIRVSPFDADEPDYGAEVLETFARFKQGEVSGQAFDTSRSPDMNHVEANVLDLVARLQPQPFAALLEFGAAHADFVDAVIGRFDREIQFYTAYLEHADRLRAAGLRFCYPAVGVDSNETFARSTFDLALAALLVDEDSQVVTNDFELHDPERVLVVSGPNQGGKTTFARTIGQLHHLVLLGCPVPGSEARLGLVDRIFTHFERQEDVETLTGKLEEDLRRIRAILAQASANSLLVMNESFASTTADDALFLNTQILHEVIERGMLCVVVTFLDELSRLGPATVSMVSTVREDDPAQRTFRIVRQPADGRAYAAAIAHKYRLGYEDVHARISQ